MKANDWQRLSALSELEREFPGSVIINESTGSITLVGWTLEQLDDAENDEGGSSHDQDFVPVIKGKFGQRVFHYLSRLFFRG